MQNLLQSKIIVGLGNPGKDYIFTRHNVGFMAVDAIAEFYSFPSFSNKFNSLVSKLKINDDSVILLKPQTYMNRSGIATAEAMKFYNIAPSNVLVIHDELDMEPLSLKYKQGGGSAGHNGLRDITNHIGADYRRLRVGIGRPNHNNVADYVLSNFSKTEIDSLPPILNFISNNVMMLFNEKHSDFLSNFASSL